MLSQICRQFFTSCSFAWCPYKKAEAAGELDRYRHKNNLPACIMDAIKPIFKDLANTALLSRCVDGYTQNANESVNSLVWKHCPKTGYHGLKVVEISVTIAVCVFNDGARRIADILTALELNPGSFTRRFIEDKDTVRLLYAERQADKSTKEFRRAQRLRRLGREEELEELEGHPYQAGGY